MKTVKHQAFVNDWNSKILINNPKTLVLGSFNPYEDKSKTVDYYYGRKSNHFWQIIAENLGYESDYFFYEEETLTRKISVMNNRFICFDLIEALEISSENEDAVNLYLKNKIFKNFADSNVWLSKTGKNQGEKVNIVRKYNEHILDFLSNNSTITRIIHTMGKTTLAKDFCSPKEKKMREKGFSGYIKKIKDYCHEKGIKFIEDGMSPSGYAVNNGSSDRLLLKKFLAENLHLGQ